MKRPSVSWKAFGFQYLFERSLALRRLAAHCCFDDFAGFEAGGADTNPLVGAVYTGAHRTQVHVPTAAAHVVSVADLISKLRAFAADVANLCHSIELQISDAEGL
jgi:hypothetical protein